MKKILGIGTVLISSLVVYRLPATDGQYQRQRQYEFG